MKAIRGLLGLVTAALIIGSSLEAVAASGQGFYGKVVNDQNRAIANTVITASQAGRVVGTVRSGSDGSYQLPVADGAYSLTFTPPTAANSVLKAYDILAPLKQSMTVMLTTPMPGRAFVTGNVSFSTGEALATDGYVSFGTFASGPTLAANGDYRFTPTAGTTGTWALKVANKFNFSVNLQGQTTQSINQDTMANFVVPIGTQRIRVVTSTGTPVAGATISGGVGSLGTNLADIAPVEGLGAFKAAWKNTLTTDSTGWASTSIVKTAAPALAGFTVGVPANYKYETETFTKTVGNGDLTLTLSKPTGQLNGYIRDAKGLALGPIDIGFGNYWTTTDANGNYAIAVANDSQGGFDISYRTGATGAAQTAIGLRSQGVKETVNGVVTRNFNLPIDTTVVKVVDSTGAPVVGANVRLTDDLGYTRLGQVTLVPGQPAMWGGFTAIDFTDAKGLVSLRTLHLDAAVKSMVVVTPAVGSPLSWGMYNVQAGQGAPITITMPRPAVNVSGKVTFTDGTSTAGMSLVFSAGNGGDQGNTVVSTDGSYTMKVPVGMKGQFYLGCMPDQRSGSAFFCPGLYGGSSTITTDTVRDVVVPTYKTPIHVVNPDGVGLANVTVLINTDMAPIPCQGRTSVLGSNIMMNWVSRAVTDSNGWAYLPTVTQDKPCNVYLLLTPDPTSRYQTRNLNLTIGDGASNVIVLTIPAPVLNAASAVANTDGSKLVTITGDNFLGVFGITVNGVAITKFTVVSKTQITFTLPAGATGGTVVVTNGGGTGSLVLK
jgi:IPT/TIG domain